MMIGNRFFAQGGCFGNGFFGGWHLIMMAAIVILAIVLIIWAKKRHFGTTDDSALNMLKENFVKGVITEEEYLSRKNILTRK